MDRKICRIPILVGFMLSSQIYAHRNTGKSLEDTPGIYEHCDLYAEYPVNIWVSDQRPTVSGIVDGCLPGYIRFYIDGTLRDSVYCDWCIEFWWTPDFDLNEGSHTWEARIIDGGMGSPSTGTIPFGIDTTPPLIDSTTQWQDTSFSGPFEIWTKVQDTLAGVDSVFLYYKRKEDPDWIIEVMEPSGNWYYEVIPSVSNPNDTICYYIQAIDKTVPPNISQDPPGSYYCFVSNLLVIEELPKENKFLFLVDSPTRGKVVFKFSISERSIISLSIYDATGRIIAILLKGEYPAGFYEIPFTPKRKGVYFYLFRSFYREKLGKFVIF